MNIITRFNLKETVQIIELKRIGKILSIYVSESGVQYQIRYFEGGDAKTCYFYEDEISEDIKEKTLGFTEKV